MFFYHLVALPWFQIEQFVYNNESKIIIQTQKFLIQNLELDLFASPYQTKF